MVCNNRARALGCLHQKFGPDDLLRPDRRLALTGVGGRLRVCVCQGPPRCRQMQAPAIQIHLLPSIFAGEVKILFFWGEEGEKNENLSKARRELVEVADYSVSA